MKHSFILLIFVFLVQKSFTQNYPFSEVTLEQLQETEHPLEPDAKAALLFKRAYSGFNNYYKSGSFFSSFVLQKRIKIYSKEGFDLATVQEEYYTSRNFKVTEASIYQLRNNEIKKTTLSKNDFFIQKTGKNKEKINFTFPDVQIGDIIDLEFQLNAKKDFILPVWYFQEDIPVNFSEIYAQIPGALSFRENTIKLQTNPQRYNPQEHPEEFTTDQIKASKKNHVFKYTVENAPSIQVEPWLYNPKRYLDKLDIQWVGVANSTSKTNTFYNSWNYVVESYYTNSKIDPQVNKSFYFSKDIRERMLDIPRDQQVHWVLNFLHEKFNKKPDENSPRYSLEDSYKHSLATDYQLDQHFIYMLRYLGFKAFRAATINRVNRIFTTESYPYLDTYFVAVLENDKWNFYEPSDPLLPKGFLPPFYYNKKVLIYDVKMEQPLINFTQPANTIEEWKLSFTIENPTEATRQVEVQVTKNSTGFEAFMHRSLFRSLDNLDEYITAIEEDLATGKIDNYRIYNEANPDEELKEVFSIQLEDAYQVVNQQLFIEPLLFLSTSGNLFKSETRLYPVELPYPYTKRIKSTFTIPSGYEVEFLPEAQQIPVLGAKADFRIRYILHENNSIETQYSLSFRKADFLASEYPELKRLFDEISNLETTPIILKKIN